MNENDDDEKWVDPGAWSGEWSHPGDCNENDDGQGD